MSVDRYLDRIKTADYDCLAFARDVWLDQHGVDLWAVLDGFLLDHTRAAGARLSVRHLRRFRVLAAPSSPCLVLFQRPPFRPHIGVMIRGRVLHLTDAGVRFDPLDYVARTFKSHRLITC